MQLAGLTIALLVALVACSRHVAPAPATASCEGETDRARAAAATIEREWPLRGADDMTAFVRELGARLATEAPTPPRRWAFVVVRNRAVNAFAVGDGRIYVTDGAIDACATEAELAAMVAHEMGHQLANHFCTDERVGNRKRIGALVQHIDPDKELEADRVAVQILTAAGYDPRAALSVAMRVTATPAGAGADFNQVRIQALRQLVATAPAGGLTDSEDFRRLKRVK